MNVSLWIHVVVDNPPLLQESMHTQNGTNIPCEIPPAAGHREILRGVQPKTVNHEVSVGQVAVWCVCVCVCDKWREREREREREGGREGGREEER